MYLSNLFRRLILCILFSFAGLLPVVAQTEGSFDRQKLNTYLNSLYHGQKFMGTVDIDSAGSDVYNQSVGFISAEKDTIMANGQTIYRIGSITKMFTATIVMQLIEEDRLTLSTTLSKFFPDMSQYESVTVEHLLRHQSGIPNLTPSNIPQKWLTEPPTMQEKLAFFKGLELEFKPGSNTSYSNTNYSVFELIIEGITGEPYASQLQKRITGPLNLRHTYFGGSSKDRQNEAASFEFEESRWKEQPESNLSISGSAGGILSTPDDLTDFIHALFEGKLVSQKSLDKMTTFQEGIGLGMSTRIPFADGYAYGHTGGIDGFQSLVCYFPGRKVAMAYTGNGLNYSSNDLRMGLLRIYFGKDFKIPDFQL